MRELDELGMRRVLERAAEVAGRGTVGVHVSFDMDVLDPEFAPGTGTPVTGGLDYREAHLAMEMLADLANVVALDLVEINPVLDVRNVTAELGVELVLSALGKRIY
jgi:arginase